MNKSKKVLSGVLAVLMLVSMLACIVLPVTAEEAQIERCYVSTVKEWNALAAKIKASDDNGAKMEIHIQKDINFSTKRTYDKEYTVYTIPTQIAVFAGKLYGHGHKFSGINAIDGNIGSLSKKSDGTYQQAMVYGAGTTLIGTLIGTIQDLTLDSTCTFDAGDNASFGPFALTLAGGTIQKCASYATISGTGALGGFVGAATDGTIDGCIFAGSGTMNAFAASSTGTTIQYSYPYDDGTTEVKEAVWTINNQRQLNVTDGIYLNVDANGIPCFGNEYNRVVRVTTTNGGNTKFAYYAPRKNASSNTVQNSFTPKSIEGKVWVVEGAERSSSGNSVYVGHEDIAVTYHDTVATSGVTEMNGATFYTEYKIEQEKAELRSMVEAYEKMDSAYFGSFAFAFEISTNEWLNKAKEVLAVGDFEALTKAEYEALSTDAKRTAAIEKEQARIAELEALPARLQEIVEQEQNLDDYAVAMTKPEDYPSIQDYKIYKYVDSIKGYKIENAADWMKAVELSNYVENPNATDFAGITLHLAKNIDMDEYEGTEPMLPLCYGRYFNGNLDGHGYAFENVKMEIDSPYGPVGLIGVLGETVAGTVQNVGIESGSIKVTGQPRYKSALSISDTGNRVGGFVGKNNLENTLIRKCWNNADISVENDTYVAGILGDGRKLTRIDNCINQGNVTGYGILGYGYKNTVTSNSMSGAVNKSVVWYAASVLGINEADSEEYIKTYINNVCGVKSILDLDRWTTGMRADEQALQKTYNAEKSKMSNAAAGWMVNAHYAENDYGDRVYYTLDKNGNVRFGEKSNQIYRIKMVCDDHKEACTEHPTRYAYGIAGEKNPITLSFDIGANYYACADENVTIKGNVLTFREGAEANENTFTVYVGYDADRGNVNNSDNGIDVLDALDAVRMAVGKATLDLKTADVNSNYKVDINDAYLIIRHTLRVRKSLSDAADFVAGKPESKADYLKVLTYNIKSFHYNPYAGNDNNNGATMSRLDEVMNELIAIDADIIGFQEIDKYNNDALYDIDDDYSEYGSESTDYIDQLEVIKEKLTKAGKSEAYYTSFFVTIPNTSLTEKYPGKIDEGGYGHGIISKYPILDGGNGYEYFAGKGQPMDPTKRLDDEEPRGFTWHRIDLGETGADEQDILFYNCHLMEYSAAQLQYMTDHMEKMKEETGLRIVCTGDLNLGAYNAEGNFNAEKFTALNGGENFNTYISTNAHSGSMIDNILVSNDVEYFKFGESALSGAPALNTRAPLYGYREDSNPYSPDTEEQKALYADKQWAASDHLPIWAYIKK